MTPSRPYLLRGLYDWIVDNGLTPHLLVNAEAPDIQAPLEFAEEGRLVLNISPTAVRALDLGNDAIEFDARFAGKPRHVWVPMAEVLAIYARENGRGMLFSEEDGQGDPPPDGGGDLQDTQGDSGEGRGRPGLRVVK